MPVSGAPNPSIATTPLELLGTHAGLSVVDPGTVLTRLWYFDGKFLRAEGFRRDQEYVRSLVALSNQATGRGVVHGLDVGRADGDRLRIEGGLALAPSGRVVYLPQQVELSIAELIARSARPPEPSPAGPGVAAFRRCPPDAPAGPEVTVPARPLYLLTVSAIEALCGEEERFGQLCEDACATETDRSTVVEGVCFRVRELTLALPTSTAVPFGPQHLRSRVASALFEQERRTVPSMVSGAGLRNPVWCTAAEGIGGEEVALAVFDRSGAVTGFVDGWAARRELMETTARRYWAARTAMRPWDVFLAQVLQFQCQLLDLGEPGIEGGSPDQCAEEHDTLRATRELLAELAGGTGTGGGLAADAAERVEVLRATITAVLDAGGPEPGGPRTGAPPTGARSATGSLLVDGGIIEVPAAGYLPVSLQSDVQDQVRALFGPGVDLRFCAVQPDYVPGALLEAQHMERISLTRGLDDPADLEQVDVLVPGGEIVDRPDAAVAAFVGVLRIEPRLSAITGSGSALSLSAVARESGSTGWSWTLAAFGEAPRRLSVPDLADGLLRAARTAFAAGRPAAEKEGGNGSGDERRDGETRDDTDDREGERREEGADTHEAFIRPDAVHDRRRLAAGFTQRLRREARLAAERKVRLQARAHPFAGVGEPEVDADRPLAGDEDRPVAVWLDVETALPLDELPAGESTTVRARASVYSRGVRRPVLADARLTGTLRVVDVVGLGSRKVIRTLLNGVVDIVTGGDQMPPEVIRAFELDWAVGVAAPGARGLAVTTGHPIVASASFTDTGDPRHVVGDAALVQEASPDDAAPHPVPAGGIAARASARVPLAALELDADDGALAPGAAGRTLAESVIAIIGAELAPPDRDPGFTAYATDRMLAGVARRPGQRVRASTDWVLFHRRRTRVCVGETTRPPSRVRTYRLFHRRVEGNELGRFEALRASLGTAVDDLGFEPVATLEFDEGAVEMWTPAAVLRAGWGAAERGNRLLIGAVGDLGEGDGEAVALGRLGTVRTVLGDLIDSAAARLEYLLEVPPEFREPGIDGVLFTVGVTDVVRTCITTYRLTSEPQFGRVLDRVRKVGDTESLETTLRSVDAAADVFVVEFADDQIVDVDALRTEWSGGFRASRAVIGLPGATGAAEDVAAWRQRSARVAEVIPGLDSVDEELFAVQTGECGAVLLVLAEVVIT